MKKLFLFLVIAGFAFASCGQRAPRQAETVEESKCCSTDYFVIEEEIIVFDDEDYVE